MKPTGTIFAVCCVIALLSGCEGGTGAGQQFDSPNGSLTASATQQLGKGLVVTETHYRIRDKSTGKTVWQHDERSHGSNDPPWSAGFGNLELIQWSADSAEVRFALQCADTVNVTEWIAAQKDQSGAFATGVKKLDGLRNEDRTKQQPAPSAP